VSSTAWTTIEDAIQAWIVAGSGLAADHVTWSGQTAPRPVGEFISMTLTMLERRGRDWVDQADNVLVVPQLTISAVDASLDQLTAAGHGLATGDGPIQGASTGAMPGGLAAATNYWAIVTGPNTFKLAATFPNAVNPSPVAVDVTSIGSGTITFAGTPATRRAGQEISTTVRGPRRMRLDLQCFAGAPTGGAATGATRPAAVLHDAIASHAMPSRAAALAAAGVGVGRIDDVRTFSGVVNTTRLEPRASASVELYVTSELVETGTYIQTVNATDQIPSPSTTLTVTVP
jgi:hypothetical protein